MTQKKSLIFRLMKNIFVFGGLFIVLSFIVDWYRAPATPTQFEQQVHYDIQNQPKIIAQLSHEKPMLLYFGEVGATFVKWFHQTFNSYPKMAQKC